ncbi:glycoside hydrolase family 3 N-terminal domain-containing protein [Actinoplanes sp. NEAU-A12]|uniref:beta-glucosidase n=1 Tax=Actinoplanes sandaracinus TaxID=3045177 RepID=A0ABT6WV96_9ACTN|nr:glycoside hydrolase family 3 N-terminal domain-containing protein [Actinoplanes sandaracinus]MDI6103535.1 glycoside hydrolase family 3 N-terminal domain-containing protein [Actinoplanes sandaracinus]
MPLPYQDSSLAVAERVEDLLGRMTLPEKVGQMLQLDARQDLAEIVCEKMAGSILHTSPDKLVEAATLVARTRLRIPLITAEDCIHGHAFWPGATVFPTQLGMAATWDPALVEQVARVTAVEAAATGVHWTFSPVLCISRDLRWGRVDETFGEDPYLISELGAAMIRGYQGEGLTDPTAILATAKHFAGYSETHGGRDASEADISRRKLRSWFLPPFQRAAAEGCRVFMLGYQSMDGVPITANKWLLNDVLKDEWGFTGTLVTDWDNVGRMVWEQKVCADYAEAAATAVKAGNDVIMTTPAFFEGAQEAIRRGSLREDEIDAAVRRILRLKFELGLFENPRTPDAARQREVIGAAAHTALNLEVARRSLVLLRNDGVLPLPVPSSSSSASSSSSSSASSSAFSSSKRIAVLGPNADDVSAQLGDWAGNSGQVDWMPDGHPRRLTSTVLDGLRDLLPDGWELDFDPAVEIEELVPDPEGETFPDGQPRPPISVGVPASPERLEQARRLAAAADYAIVVVGDTVNLNGEHKSTATLELQGGQIALLDTVAATGTPMIVVLIDGKPLALPPSALGAAAILQAFNPGMRGGQAIAELLFGAIEPTGRMPISAARHVGQQPIFYNQVRGQHGTRYADLTQDPLFAFGEGLSYTTVVYDGLSIEEPDVAADGVVRATVRLSNTGTRPALETVQVYVSDLVTSVTWAGRELKAYRQVPVPPGESVTVALEVAATDCTLVDAAGARVVEAGDFELLVGPNSRPSALLSAKFRIS